MTFYPAFLDLRGRPCLVVGGGAVARRKARALARAGAQVTVVAGRVVPSLRRMKGARILRRGFRAADLPEKGRRPWIVVAATDDEALNRRVARLCDRRRVWVNVVDRPALCRFIAPAVVRRGPLTFAVSTGGASPALAKFVGRRLRALFGSEYAMLASFLRRARRDLLAMPLARRRRFLGRLLRDGVVARLRRGGPAAARRRFEGFIRAARRADR